MQRTRDCIAKRRCAGAPPSASSSSSSGRRSTRRLCLCSGSCPPSRAGTHRSFCGPPRPASRAATRSYRTGTRVRSRATGRPGRSSGPPDNIRVPRRLYIFLYTRFIYTETHEGIRTRTPFSAFARQSKRRQSDCTALSSATGTSSLQLFFANLNTLSMYLSKRRRRSSTSCYEHK